MKREKILLGGMLTALAGFAIIVLLSGNSYESEPAPQVESVEQKLTELEIRTQAIQSSGGFQKEMRLRATARAMYEQASEKQNESLLLAEKAQATYRMAMELENEWKVNQSEVIK